MIRRGVWTQETLFGYFVETALAPHLLLQCSQRTSY